MTPRRSSRRTRPRARPIGATLVVTCLTIAATQSSWAVIVPVMPVYVQRFGAGALELGLVVALFGVGRLVANIPAGLLSRRVDPRILLVVSVLTVVAALVATAFAPSMPVLLALRLVTGLGGGVAITSGMILVALLSPPTARGRSMSLLHSMQLVGGSGGLVLGGLGYAAGGVRAPFLLCGVLAVLVLLVGSPFLFGRRAASLRPADPPPARAQVPADPVPRLRERSFVTVCGVCFGVFFHRFGGMQSIIPLVAYSTVGMGVAQYGVLQGLITALGLLVAVPVGMLSDRVGRKRVLTSGLLVAGLGLPLMTLSDQTWVFVTVLALTTLAVGASSPVQQAYVVDVSPAGSPGLAMGVFRSCGDLAGIVGPICLGLLADHLGLSWAVWTLALVLVLPSVLFGLLARETVSRGSLDSLPAAEPSVAGSGRSGS